MKLSKKGKRKRTGMVPDLDTFKTSTKLGVFKPRKKIKQVDDAVSDYDAVDDNDYAGKVRSLKNILFECNRYLGSAQSSHLRDEGTIALKQHAERELAIYDKLDQSQRSVSRADKFRLAVEAQDVATGMKNGGVGLGDLHFRTGQYLTEVINDINQNEPVLLETLIHEDLANLRDLINDPNMPDLTKQIISELLDNIGSIKFQEGAPGARIKQAGEAIDKAYVVKHALNPSLQLGTPERLGALAHELTHVASGESYKNTNAFLLFHPDLTTDEIADLARERKVKVEALEGLIDADATLSSTQKELLKEKIKYAKEAKMGLYAARFSDAAIAKLKVNPADPGGLAYQQLAAKFKAVSDAVPDSNSVLIEYDSVLNQMMVYMHMWGVDKNNPFYKKLQECAKDAYDAREYVRTNFLANIGV